MIVKDEKGYHVRSKDGGKNLGGPYATLKEAEERLAEIERFKRGEK